MLNYFPGPYPVSPNWRLQR